TPRAELCRPLAPAPRTKLCPRLLAFTPTPRTTRCPPLRAFAPTPSAEPCRRLAAFARAAGAEFCPLTALTLRPPVGSADRSVEVAARPHRHASRTPLSRPSCLPASETAYPTTPTTCNELTFQPCGVRARSASSLLRRTDGAPPSWVTVTSNTAIRFAVPAWV